MRGKENERNGELLHGILLNEHSSFLLAVQCEMNLKTECASILGSHELPERYGFHWHLKPFYVTCAVRFVNQCALLPVQTFKPGSSEANCRQVLLTYYSTLNSIFIRVNEVTISTALKHMLFALCKRTR